MTVSGPEKEAPMGITGFPLEKIFDMLVFESSNRDVMCEEASSRRYCIFIAVAQQYAKMHKNQRVSLSPREWCCQFQEWDHRM